MPSQAQKHVTHNEAIQTLDIVTQLAVLAIYKSAPDALPERGACYILSSDPSGDWAGYPNQIATYENPGWIFITPQAGWTAYDLQTQRHYIFDGTNWAAQTTTQLGNIEHFALGTGISDDAPFTAKLNTALWQAVSAEDGGTGSFVHISDKSSERDDLGQILQSGGQTRAVIGLFGSDDFRISVSPDSENFYDAMRVSRHTGAIEQPNLPRFIAYTNYNNYISEGRWTKLGMNMADYNNQNCFDAAAGTFVAPMSGTYEFHASVLFKENYTEAVDLSLQLVKQETQVIRGSSVYAAAPLTSERTSLQLTSLVYLDTGERVHVEARLDNADGYLVANETCFSGKKIG